MKSHLLCGLLLAASAGLCAAQDTCPGFNQAFTPNFQNRHDVTGHTTGAHADAMETDAKCGYTGNFPCTTTSTTNTAVPSGSDIGQVTAGVYHVAHNAEKSGVATANYGGNATSDAESAIAFEGCPSQDCAFTVGITGGGDGGGFSVQWPDSLVWNDTFYLKTTCTGIQGPQGGGGHGHQCGQGRIGIHGGGAYNQCGDPVIVDTGNHGFYHFTDPQKACVRFDLRADGSPLCLSWPVHGYGLAWLTLPGKDGVVRNGKQLFGNFTPQGHHKPVKEDCGDFPCANGFAALAEWDLPFAPYGGNGDVIIDAKDAVWSRLRLWIDQHCYLHPEETCISLPGELHRLDELGIHNISLMYAYDPQNSDKYGNRFRLYTHVNVEPPTAAHPDSRQESTDGRLIYDVYPVSGK